jgi:cytochrome c peroxidase
MEDTRAGDSIGQVSSALSADDDSASPGEEQGNANVERGKHLFAKETFGGNGRTCATCHAGQSGTISPGDVEALYKRHPGDPLFQADATDAAGGNTFDRIRQHATIRVNIDLPSNVEIVGSTSRQATLLRAVPTTNNVPSFDPVFQYDGRAPNLQAQARGAIYAHAQSSHVTDDQLDLIAQYELTLFNENRIKKYARKGVVPELPMGRTPAQERGRLFFTDDNPANGNPVKGRCVHCHSGPMLNETSAGLQLLIGLPAGSRFFTAFVSEFNEIGNPAQTYRFTNPDGSTTDVTSPDPGVALISGKAGDANIFKIPTVWGLNQTAPYFHDHSAADVTALLNHYQVYFRAIGFDLSDDEKSDIAEYLKLL